MTKVVACRKCKGEKPMRHSSWASALLIMIIPKCPFCVMAYSTAITMCGTSTFYMSENNWVSYLPLLLAGVIITMIALNYRDRRTIAALGLAVAGAVMVLLTHQLVIEPIWYNVGNALLFLSIFLNGPMLSFVNTITKHTYMKYLTTKLSSL